MGDLEEEFRSREQRSGRARAVLWYCAEALRSLWPMLTYPRLHTEGMMSGLDKDLRGALRILRRAPGFSAVIVLTLGIGVGAASAVYSVVRGVLLAPLSLEDPDEVVMLWGQSPEYARMPLTVGDHNVLVNEVDAFEAVTAAWSNYALLLGDAEAEQVSVGWVTPEYFEVLGVAPELGRTLEALDESAILISHALWVRRYGADAAAIGRVVDMSGEPMEIAGVLPRDRDPNLTTFGGSRADHEVWRLQPRDWTQGDDRSVGWLRSTARLREGVTLEQARAEVDALMQRVNTTVAQRDGGTDLRINLIPVKADLVSGVSRTLWILLAAVFGVLLIAASNVAHLNLARGEARSGEVAVRTALGGSRIRLVRQLLVESGVLALLGGALGLGIASFGVRALVSVAPPTIPRLDLVRLDWGVFAFALATTAAAALVFALVPALRSTRTDPAATLGERTTTRDPRRQRLSRTLVVAEVAMSLALVTSTGLLLRSFSGLNHVDLGFDKDGIVTFTVEAPDWGNTAESAAATMQAYLDRSTSVPGVRAAAFTNRVPLGGGLFTGTFRSEDMVASDDSGIEASVRYVTPEYFSTMGARLLAGRGFRPDDGLDVVVLDEIAAERAWPGRDPIGRRLETSAIGEDASFAEVIGVVAPMKHHGVAEVAVETLFLPMLVSAHRQNFRYMAVRVAGDPLAFIERLREATRAVDANAVIARIRTMRDLFEQDVAATRFAALLLSMFGGVALLLAAVGIHGVMASSVRRRAREIGIRVVLGAERRTILRDALGSGASLVLMGIAVGVLLSLGSGRLLSSLLFEVRAHDVATTTVSAAVMLAVGLVSAYLPARLVLGVDPAITLREE